MPTKHTENEARSDGSGLNVRLEGCMQRDYINMLFFMSHIRDKRDSANTFVACMASIYTESFCFVVWLVKSCDP